MKQNQEGEVMHGHKFLCLPTEVAEDMLNVFSNESWWYMSCVVYQWHSLEIQYADFFIGDQFIWALSVQNMPKFQIPQNSRFNTNHKKYKYLKLSLTAKFD